MVLALMVLPAAAAARLSRTLPQIMLLGTLFCLVSCLAGMAISYSPEWPVGAVIILVAGYIYLVASCISYAIEARQRSQKQPL
jgi:ABC-type Mn2+/Zn2+ transport system permease subunit